MIILPYPFWLKFEIVVKKNMGASNVQLLFVQEENPRKCVIILTLPEYPIRKSTKLCDFVILSFPKSTNTTTAVSYTHLTLPTKA